ncbi:MAG: c-type cytochrome [Saprospiraceae bacterium]|nr:c-type cytochrome [Saprospiraceae bacterium]
MNFFQSKHKWKMAAAAAVVLLATACTREYIQDVNDVCFQQEVLPIFQSNCTQSGCHNSNSREAGYDLSTYEGILRGVEPGKFKQSELYSVITKTFGESAMPPSPYKRLSDEQITTIALWIDGGAKNNSCQAVVCDVTNVTLSGTVMPIFETYCNGCHGGSAPLGNVDLGNYNGIKLTLDNGSLVGSVKHSSGYSAMPQGANKLTDCQISKIETWIALGAKND